LPRNIQQSKMKPNIKLLLFIFLLVA